MLSFQSGATGFGAYQTQSRPSIGDRARPVAHQRRAPPPLRKSFARFFPSRTAEIRQPDLQLVRPGDPRLVETEKNGAPDSLERTRLRLLFPVTVDVGHVLRHPTAPRPQKSWFFLRSFPVLKNREKFGRSAKFGSVGMRGGGPGEISEKILFVTLRLTPRGNRPPHTQASSMTQGGNGEVKDQVSSGRVAAGS